MGLHRINQQSLMIDRKRCSSSSQHPCPPQTKTQILKPPRRRHNTTEIRTNCPSHHCAEPQSRSLTHSFFCSNQQSQPGSVVQKRKNSTLMLRRKSSVHKLQKEGVKKGEEMTPFQKRRLTAKVDIKQKIKEIQNRKRVSFILQETVKNWLVINELKSNPKELLSLQTQNIDVKLADLHFKEETPPKSEEDKFTAENRSVSQQKTSATRVEGLQSKDQLAITVNGSKMRSQNMFSKTQSQQTSSGLSFKNLRMFNCSSIHTNQQKNKTHHSKISIFFTKINCMKEKLNINHSYKQSKVCSPEKGGKMRCHGEVLTCSKIDICKKEKTRPQTAISKPPRAQFWTKPAKRSPESHQLLRQITGWQDLTDSVDKQIFF